jgi:hypothetical protein
MRQTVVVVGFEAWMAARLGREESGISGGEPAWSAEGRLAGRGGGSSVALLRPNERAERFGGTIFSAMGLGAVDCRDGSGGLEGSVGGGTTALGS